MSTYLGHKPCSHPFYELVARRWGSRTIRTWSKPSDLGSFSLDYNLTERLPTVLRNEATTSIRWMRSLRLTVFQSAV
jgi:hypothetical protein